uniref:Uncharacterized protein n=1 Tax=Candidatus Kentrum sp. FW TaxID=2126338 RepID=A0A450SYE1_9GAMM|nr:MAG: hypothetical protein BECKFW1821B_GA0114236_104610 [Candidatus Kentron sp. FW]
MAIYTVLINKNEDYVLEKIENQYEKKDFHITEDGYIFLSDTGLTKEVGKKIGLLDYEGPEDRQPAGLIIKQEHVTGYYYESFWEWMNSLKDDSV